MASAPRVLDQAYVPQSSAEKGEPAAKSPPMSSRSPSSSRPSSPKQEPTRAFNQMSEREQVRHLWGSRRRKTRASKKSRKQRRKTLKRRAK
jgi:hypothetical protein